MTRELKSDEEFDTWAKTQESKNKAPNFARIEERPAKYPCVVMFDTKKTVIGNRCCYNFKYSGGDHV